MIFSPTWWPPEQSPLFKRPSIDIQFDMPGVVQSRSSISRTVICAVALLNVSRRVDAATSSTHRSDGPVYRIHSQALVVRHEICNQRPFRSLCPWTRLVLSTDSVRWNVSHYSCPCSLAKRIGAECSESVTRDALLDTTKSNWIRVWILLSMKMPPVAPGRVSERSNAIRKLLPVHLYFSTGVFRRCQLTLSTVTYLPLAECHKRYVCSDNKSCWNVCCQFSPYHLKRVFVLMNV
jgi:hypothetical protein